MTIPAINVPTLTTLADLLGPLRAEAEADRFCNIYRHTYRHYVEQPTWTPPAPEPETEPKKVYHIQEQDVIQRGRLGDDVNNEPYIAPIISFKRSPHYQPFTSLIAAKRAAVEGWDDSYKGAPDSLIAAMYVRFRRLGHIRIEHERVA